MKQPEHRFIVYITYMLYGRDNRYTRSFEVNAVSERQAISRAKWTLMKQEHIQRYLDAEAIQMEV